MKNTLLACLVALLAACGGSTPPPAQPADPVAAEPSSKEPGIGQAEVTYINCIEQCMDTGPDPAPADWATTSDADKQTACNATCKDAGAGEPSDQP